MFCIQNDGRAGDALFDELNEDAVPVLRSVVDASPDCFKFLDADGTLSFMNENGQRIMEIDDIAEVIGAEWSSLWPEKERPTLKHALQEAREGRAVRFEAFCPTAKGRPAWWDVSVTPVFDGAGAVTRLLSISREITHRVELEAALKEREAELERLLRRQRRGVA